ncbi:MAG: hypothetical protein RJA81_53 [Planctomycetota bacterium]|jgi:nucleoside-diphosphate-sugar epimerase
MSSNPSSLLIVGCGYLGLRVASLATEAGWKVYGTSRKESRRSELQNSGAEPVIFDLLNPVTHRNLPQVQKWLWCPAFDRSQGVSPEAAITTGLIQTLQNVKQPPEHLVFVSTTGVFHQNDGSWVDEMSETEPVSESGVAHLRSETLISGWGHANRAKWQILRLSGLYGPGRWIRRKSIESGEPISCDPDSWLNLLHIEDAARGCLAVLGSDPESERTHGLFCVTDDRPVLRREFYQTSARLLKAPDPVFQIPQNGDFGGNKRVSNRKFKEVFGWKPQLSDINSGLPACF